MTSDYGTYRLAFEPPADQITPGVEMTLSGEADLNQMLAMFESFLQASGYVLKGELQIVEPEANPYFTGVANFDFGNHVIYGGQGTDTISFGAAQPVEFGAKTRDDVISFG